jgi:hypothetical protein
MSDKRKKTILQKKIEWFFEHCAQFLTPIDLEVLLKAQFSEDGTTLEINVEDLKPRFQDIIKLAKKLGKNNDAE